jgi:hypothetical protein
MRIEYGYSRLMSAPDLSSGGGSCGQKEPQERNTHPSPEYQAFDLGAWIEDGAPPIVPPFEHTPPEHELAEGSRKARKFFEATFAKRWNLRTDWQAYRTAQNERRRLEWMFPDVYDSVLLALDIVTHVEDHRRFRQFLATQLSPEELQRRRRGMN